MKKKSRIFLIISILCIAVLLSATALGDGWQQSNGRWWYSYKNGSYASNKWLKDGNNWYYFDASGWMQTGWMADGGTWYYFGTDGAMKTGWQNIAGSWYFFSSNGAMEKGWKKSGNSWYYLNASGVMQTEWMQDGYTRYYFGSDGIMKTGFQVINGKTYYFNSDGIMQTGWNEIDSYWYYFYDDGSMAINTIIDGRNVGADGRYDPNPYAGMLTYGENNYKVGTDFIAGEYVLIATEDIDGYFCISSDANGRKIIENGIFSYNSIITVKNGEYLELVRCMAIRINDFYSKFRIPTDRNGVMLKVGYDIKPGEYKVVADTDGRDGYYCIYSSSRQDKIVKNSIFKNSAYVNVRLGEYLELNCCHIQQ